MTAVPEGFQEYPKWVVPDAGGEPVLCEDAEAEKAVNAPKRGRPPKGE